MAVIECHNHFLAGTRHRVGILGVMVPSRGAVAITIAHDSHNLVVLGDNDADMLLCWNTSSRNRAEWSLWKNGCVVVDALPLRAAGL